MQKYVYDGEINITDVRGGLAFQSQPRIEVPLLLHQLAPTYSQSRVNLHYDPYLNCAYPREIFIPHDNRVTSGASVLDGDQHLLWGDTNKRMNWGLTLS